MNINRRHFLALPGGLLLANTLGCSSFITAQSPRRIIVAGAGLAGLSVACELSQLGYEVIVIEGRDRVGGRICTLKQPFTDDQYVELGGELIGDGYKRLLGYAHKLNVGFEEVPVETSTGGNLAASREGINTAAIFKQKLYPVNSIMAPHPYLLTGDEAKLLPPALLSKYLRQMLQEVTANPSRMRELDPLSLAGALRQFGVSETAISLMNISLNYNSIETVSAASPLLDAQRRASAGTKVCRITGGNTELVTAMAEQAAKQGVKFILQANIRKISYTPNAVKISFRDNSGRINGINAIDTIDTIEAAKLVCTIPFSVLREVEFSPPLPPAKMKAVNELAYTSITKIYFQGSRVEWDRRNLGSSIWTDTPLERIFTAAGKRGDARGIFTAWMDGEGSNIADQMSDEKRQRWAKNEFEKALPFMQDAIASTHTKSWANDEFARGAYAHFTRGQFTTLQPVLKTVVGPIHFAGEHTAEKSPGMEGALESAERVVAEVLSASL